MLKLPEDMVGGFECLDYEVPWIVPEAIYKLDESLKPDDVVFEFGGGGSTLFYLRRCASVYCIETSYDWAAKVHERVPTVLSKNLKWKVIPTEKNIIGFLERISINNVSVLSVDMQGHLNRSKILSTFLMKEHHALRMIILDDYGHNQLYPDHFDKGSPIGDGWDVFTYNHERWSGSGTKILIKK